MKFAYLTLMAILFVSGVASADVYECQMQPENDPWASTYRDSFSTGDDTWWATVDTSKGTVELSSENGIFGVDPFAILTLSNPRGFPKGTQVFRGANLKFKTYNYVFAFSGATAEMERREGRDNPKVNNSFECVKR